jgi:hypothetical protein
MMNMTTHKVFTNSDIVFETNDGDTTELLIKKEKEVEDHFRLYIYNYEQDVGMNIKLDIYQFAEMIREIWPYIPQEIEL